MKQNTHKPRAPKRRKAEASALKKISNIILIVIAQLVAVCFLLAGVELFYRKCVTPPSDPWVMPAVSAAVEKKLPSPSDPEPATHVPVHIPQHLFEGSPPLSWVGLLKKTFQPYYLAYDSDVGFSLPMANQKVVVTEVLPDGKVVYKVTYTIDGFKRRVTPDQMEKSRVKPLLFLGCSYTFGEGLNANQTLPSQVARRAKKYKVYNYGHQGGGPGNILRWVSAPHFSEGIPEKGGVAVYVFMDQHMVRTVGNLSLSKIYPFWRADLPYYFLDEKGDLKTDGSLYYGRPLETWLFTWLAKSAFINDTKIDIPFRFTEYHFKLITALLKEIKAKLQDEVGIDNFYVLFYPGSNLAKPLIHYLDEAGISSLDYSHIYLGHYVNPPAIPYDGHPSAEAQNFMASLLVNDLKLGGEPKRQGVSTTLSGL